MFGRITIAAAAFLAGAGTAEAGLYRADIEPTAGSEIQSPAHFNGDLAVDPGPAALPLAAITLDVRRSEDQRTTKRRPCGRRFRLQPRHRGAASSGFGPCRKLF